MSYLMAADVVQRIPGLSYTRFQRFAAKRRGLPGQVQVGKYQAFDAAKLKELEAELRRVGFIREVLAA